MDLKQFNELDFSNFGDWPGIVKGVAILILCGAVGGAWYYFDTDEQIGRLKTVARKETELRGSFEGKHRKAANLEAYRQQLEEMKESFGTMLRQLPNKTEVAGLLVDVSQTGLAAGLKFELFQPSGELTKDFYAELPIQVRVTGRYHEFGRFISGLAALPRIVTIHDVGIDAPQKRGGDSDQVLALEATVKTYRYLEEETGTQKPGGKPKVTKKTPDKGSKK
jgi:type IV pilus assembly protein PilO